MGGTTRAVTRAAKGGDPRLRKDGLAFLLLAVAIVIAIREWFGLSGLAGDVIHHAAAGLIGVLGVLLPVLLAILAIRLFRNPEDSRANGRVTIGVGILVAAVAGLVHIGSDLPSPSRISRPRRPPAASSGGRSPRLSSCSSPCGPPCPSSSCWPSSRC